MWKIPYTQVTQKLHWESRFYLKPQHKCECYVKMQQEHLKTRHTLGKISLKHFWKIWPTLQKLRPYTNILLK